MNRYTSREVSADVVKVGECVCEVGELVVGEEGECVGNCLMREVGSVEDAGE